MTVLIFELLKPSINIIQFKGEPDHLDLKRNWGPSLECGGLVIKEQGFDQDD